MAKQDRMGRVIASCCVLLSILFVSNAEAVVAPIQPGARLSSPVGGCTMNFVFAGTDGTRYIGTAGHCTNTGDRIRDADGIEFGTTALSYYVGNDDFALIRIDTGRLGDVSPQLRTWGGPAGYTTAAETGFLAPVLLHGYGIVWGTTEFTRPRRGALYYDDSSYYRTLSPISNGDSGGPILHEATGKALGIVSNFGSGMFQGPTVERALQIAAREGFPVSLVTAAFPA